MLYEWNARESFPSASLIKLEILWHYFRCLDQSALMRGQKMVPFSPEQIVVLRNEHYVEGFGVLKDLPPGAVMRLCDLATLMITVSDNIATNLLIEVMGMDPVNETIALLGLEQTKLQRKSCDWARQERGLDNLTSPADTAHLLDAVLCGTTLPEKLRQEFYGMLLKQQCRNKFAFALAGSGTMLAHKTGELPGVEHDAGIFTKNGKQLIIVAMTKNIMAKESKAKEINNGNAGIQFCRGVAQAVSAAYFAPTDV